MRITKPRNWIFMTDEEKETWRKEHGQKIVDDYQKARKMLEEEIKKRKDRIGK